MSFHSCAKFNEKAFCLRIWQKFPQQTLIIIDLEKFLYIKFLEQIITIIYFENIYVYLKISILLKIVQTSSLFSYS